VGVLATEARIQPASLPDRPPLHSLVVELAKAAIITASHGGYQHPAGAKAYGALTKPEESKS
jgi:hypothetical protein